MTVKVLILAMLLTLAGFSATGKYQTSEAATLPAAPTVPINLKIVTASSSTVRISWSASSSKAGVKFYTVYRNGSKLAVTTKLTYTSGGLKSLTAYRYTVSATDVNLKSSAQSTAVSTTTTPVPPTGLFAATISTTQVSLAWRASTDSAKLTGYNIYRNGAKIKTVAKTLTTYTDSGRTPGATYTYSVNGYYNTSKLTEYTNLLSVKTLVSAPVDVSAIGGCTDISAPGTYTLGYDISSFTMDACIKIHDTSNVDLDCKNHKILSNDSKAISVINVTAFTLKNCHVTAQGVTPDAVVFGVEFLNTTDGLVQGNTFTGNMVMQANNNTRLSIKNNTLTSAAYQQQYGQYNYFGYNTISGYSQSMRAGLIIMTYGSFNTVESNTLDGQGGGNYGAGTYYGTDDGIVIQYEDSDMINNNTMVNFFDCGIETLGLISNTTFRDNMISKATECGIGGWYFNSWRNNTVSGNYVDSTGRLFWFFRYYGLQPGEQYVYFENNRFTNNYFTNTLMPGGSSASFSLTNISGVPDSSVKATNNTFTGNNFGTAGSSPYFVPKALVVDGGSNICGMYDPNSSGHLACR